MKYRLICCLCFLITVVFGQQLEFRKQQTGGGVMTGFYAGYSKMAPEEMVITDTAFYKQKKIKTILVSTPDLKPKYLVELDTAGNIVRSGTDFGDYFLVTGTSGTNPLTATAAWYKNYKLFMADTTLIKNYNYKNGDTTMYFSRREKRVYKTGSLLNEQNRFYNTYYLRRLGRVCHDGQLRPRKIFGKKLKPKRHIYLLTRRSTHFDSLKLYAAYKSIDETYFSAYNTAGDIKTSGLKKHPFYKSLHKTEKRIGIARGEKFTEPSGYRVVYPGCGYSNREPGPTYEKYEFSTNANGLYEAYYRLWFPPETDIQLIKKYRQGLGNQYNSFNGNEQDMPRKSTPEKKLLYIVQYDYF